ncbi:MAG: hypothetical protein V3V00_12205 [Saprospiraceae bacterium]
MNTSDSLFKQYILILIYGMVSLSAFTQTVYVSTSGLDSNNGLSPASSVLTFQKGADVAKAQGANGVTVEFADGEYVFNSTVVLDGTYSGIRFQAAPGATPVFTSLVKITGWTQEGQNFVAPLPSGIQHVRYLQDKKSNWLERSASALFRATETSTVADGCLECNWDDPAAQTARLNIQYPLNFTSPDWSLASQYDLRESTLQWLQEIIPIQSVDVPNRRITTTIPASLELRLDSGESPLVNNNWVLNSEEGIDVAGEWASLDEEIYLFPKTDTSDIYAPQLTELIRVDAGGDGNTWTGIPVKDITFQGITFTGGDFYMMVSNEVTSQHDWAVVDKPTALLRFRNAENMTVDGCTFTKSGSTGVRFDRYAQNNKVTNSNFSYLGRGGIRFIGRGPGYGDVNKNNEISSNTLGYTGMEKWSAAAILMDQSSSNHIHHNYISNTYFSALILTGPRQIMFLSRAENGGGYLGREFHYYQIAQTVLDAMAATGDAILGSYEGMNFVYNYENLVEKNTFVDVSTGQGYLENGYIYTSGIKRGAANKINYNYIFDSGNNPNNNAAFYSDSDQDSCQYIGNMINGVMNNDGVNPFPMWLAFGQYPEGDPGQFPASGTIQIKGTVTINSTFTDYVAGLSFTVTGTVFNATGGAVECLPIYSEMYSTLCTGKIAGPKPIHGAQQMLDTLSKVITNLGGTLPDCTNTTVNCTVTQTINGLSGPSTIYFNSSGDVLVPERSGHKLSAINPITNAVSTIAGTGVLGNSIGSCTSAQFNEPYDVVEVNNKLYLADGNNNIVKEIETSPSCSVTNFASSFGGTNFGTTTGIAKDATGNIYVVDFTNKRVVKFNAAGQPGTAPNSFDLSTAGAPGNTDSPARIAISGNNMYVSKVFEGKIEKVDLTTGQRTDFATGLGEVIGLSIDGAGNILAASQLPTPNIFKISPGGSVTTIMSGSPLNHPRGVAEDAQGNIWIANWGGNNVLKITCGQNSNCPQNYAGVNKLTGVQIIDSTFQTNGILESNQQIIGANVIYRSPIGIELLYNFEIQVQGNKIFEIIIGGCE